MASSDSQTSTLQTRLNALIDGFINAKPLSKAAAKQAQEVLPASNTRSVLNSAPFPLDLKSGEVYSVTSVDRRKYIDFVSDYLAGIKGHSYPSISQAVSDSLPTGLSLGRVTTKEARLGEILCNRLPSIERVRFCNSGTEAITFAVATALAFPKREKALVFENGYHGGTISFSIAGQANPLNLPYEFILGKYNDDQATAPLIDDSIGAILVEPMQAVGGMRPASQEFLQFLRQMAGRSGAVLIFDEVVTSRFHFHGLQGAWNVIPDMTTLGKYLGGGIPFGDFGGSRHIMDLLDPSASGSQSLSHSGTFNNNIFTMTAAVAAAPLVTEESLGPINALGDQLRMSGNEIVQKAGFGQMELTGYVRWTDYLSLLTFSTILPCGTYWPTNSIDYTRQNRNLSSGSMGFDDKRVAIVGGGLGGMSFLNAALYAGLKKVQLYEQAPQFAEVGAGVNITSNANRVLDAFGLKESMTRRSSRKLPCYMEYHSYRTGEYLGHIDEFSQPSARLLHRAHLLESLKERVPQSSLNLGKRLASIDRNNGTDTAPYTLHFEDGSSAEADIVIGCDGIKSNVRDSMDLSDTPNYSGQVVYRGFVDYKNLPPDTAQLLRRTVNFRGPKRHVLILPIGNKETDTDRAAIIGFMSEPLEAWDSESWMSRSDIYSLQEHVRDWCPQVQDIIAGLRKSSPDGRMLKQALYVRDPLDKWYEMKEGQKGAGIILLGDSAHSTLPHQGQGTCMAIESGIALATILKHWKSDDLEAAFRFYQDLRKPRTDRVTQTSSEAGRLASSDTPDQLTNNFNPQALMERMKWIMEYNVLDDLRAKGAEFLDFQGSRL
ncbi:hypothetical protein NUU61_002787 [Penicillium alfredii]|uniref:FAD-binding domain-containing protein n=1 Tax=Penicillium alfredii TaxID=1506179 RepID=A0A9W9FSW7_9EURO|nr:uncharacterized protein NUU61_002787 [Penicillium alfredii]KAJ5105440.1 hypothetical protein NUU61_002787 [Penicillium alfredii]